MKNTDALVDGGSATHAGKGNRRQGPWGRTTRKARNRSGKPQAPTDRSKTRQAAVARAVEAITSKNGELTHEAVGEMTGLPVGYLQWAFPTKTSLASASAAP